MEKIKPTAEQLKIRFEAEWQYLKSLNEHDTAGLFNMIFGGMRATIDWDLPAAERFINIVEGLQHEYFPTVPYNTTKVAQEVGEAIDGLQKAKV